MGAALGIFLVLVPLIVAPWVFIFVVSAAMLVAAHELIGATEQRGTHLVAVPLYLGVALIPQAAYWYGTLALIATFGAHRAGDPRLASRRRSRGLRRRRLAARSSWPPTPASWPASSGSCSPSDDGPERIIVFIVLTIAATSAATPPACSLGRHPMAPSISPKKSWEGFVGRPRAAGRWRVSRSSSSLLEAPWWQGLVTGLVLTVTATAGDLVESTIKRDLGIKDMGNLLPGPRRADGPARLAAARRPRVLAAAPGVPRPVTAVGDSVVDMTQDLENPRTPKPGELTFTAPEGRGKPRRHLADLTPAERTRGRDRARATGVPRRPAVAALLRAPLRRRRVLDRHPRGRARRARRCPHCRR